VDSGIPCFMPIFRDTYSRRVERVRRLHQPLRSPKTSLLLKMKVHFFETSGINNPATQRGNTEDTNSFIPYSV